MRILLMLIPDVEADIAAGTSMLRLELFAGAYYLFHDRGIEVVLASPAGGSPWMGPASPGRENADVAVLRFRKDGPSREELTDTIRLDQAYAEDFDGALCLGSPGSIWRQEHKSPAASLIADFLVAAKPVAIMPSGLDLMPHGTAEGLLISGDSARTPLLAAHALIGVLDGRENRAASNFNE
ncbi:transporter [Mesorhizobium kowhaii]|uniref:DJ-1/PfpI domain-containing protein n=1 Tax=Mesorhizobium kowhaii TaxID=1300272 RepID=A0A2W7C238_9HYPH|nr:transporter [Mesorhizobium kowhaii]PZV37170.1 hypothetical protein B5V02_17630 [Mesorhizobium kowhaii]